MSHSSSFEITADDGFRFSAYRAEPVGSPKGSVIILQELFGVNSHIRSVCDQYAEAGYVAIAPALFDRVNPDMELGYAPEDIQAGLAARDALPVERVLADVQAAIRSMAAGPVFAVGFCWGGTLAFLAAARLSGLTAAAGYYGSMIPEVCDEAPHIALMLHFGSADHTLPPDRVALVREARPDAEIFVYDAGHGFNCDERGSYNGAAAALAHERTLAFFGAADAAQA